jgi:hypothetical protein
MLVLLRLYDLHVDSIAAIINLSIPFVIMI